MTTTAESLINEGVSQQNKRSGNGKASRCIDTHHQARPESDRSKRPNGLLKKIRQNSNGRRNGYAREATAPSLGRADASVSVAVHLEDVRCGILPSYAPWRLHAV